MNEIILFSGVTIVLLLKNIAFVMSVKPCSVSQINGKKFVNCSNYTPGYSEIPPEIDLDVEYLDLSYNKLHNVTENAFKKFGKLIILTMREVRTSEYIDINTFRSLVNLEELDISYFAGAGGLRFVWPSELKRLRIEGTAAQELLAPTLTKLEFVNATDNQLSQFPQFNTKAPLETVILDENHLGLLKVEQIAPYCHIKNLSLKLSLGSELLAKKNYCDCTRINIWTNQFQIHTDALKCVQAEGDVCNKEFSEGLLATRRECLYSAAVNSDYKLVLIIACVFLLLLTLITLCCAYRYVRLRTHVQPADSDESELDDQDISEEKISE